MAKDFSKEYGLPVRHTLIGLTIQAEDWEWLTEMAERQGLSNQEAFDEVLWIGMSQMKECKKDSIVSLDDVVDSLMKNVGSS